MKGAVPMKKNTPEFDREREFKILLETIDDKFSLVVDEMKDLKTRVNVMNEELGRQRERFFVVETDIRFIKGDVKELTVGLKTLDKKVDRLSENVDQRISRIERAA